MFIAAGLTWKLRRIPIYLISTWMSPLYFARFLVSTSSLSDCAVMEYTRLVFSQWNPIRRVTVDLHDSECQ